MTILGALRPAVAIAALLALAACAEPGGTAAPTPTTASGQPDEAGGLVLRVEYGGGFTTPALTAGRLPVISVYADGRMITEGPVPAIYPGPALPNLQVAELDPAAVQGLVDRALAAGVAETADLGMPPVADGLSTRFTLVTSGATYQRDVYALGETSSGSGLTSEQVEARGRLSDLLSSMPAASGVGTSPYAADSVAAIVTPWVDREDGLVQPERPWPGPPMPGVSTGGPSGVTCLTATGAEAQAVLEAAGTANANTPWTTPDGTRWTVVFRPLLPDENGCADLPT
jgi:hypothetical protein